MNVCVATGVVVHLDAASAGRLVQLCHPVPVCGRTFGGLDNFLLAQENTRDVVPGDAAHGLGTYYLACLLGWSYSFESLGLALGDFSTLVSICWCYTEVLKDYRGATAVRVLIGTKKGGDTEGIKNYWNLWNNPQQIKCEYGCNSPSSTISNCRDLKIDDSLVIIIKIKF